MKIFEDEKDCKYCTWKSGQDTCCVIGPSGIFACIRETGHEGNHCACGIENEHQYLIWDQEGNVIEEESER